MGFHLEKLFTYWQFSSLDLKNKIKKTKTLGIVVEIIQCEGSSFGHLNEDGLWGLVALMSYLTWLYLRHPFGDLHLNIWIMCENTMAQLQLAARVWVDGW